MEVIIIQVIRTATILITMSNQSCWRETTAGFRIVIPKAQAELALMLIAVAVTVTLIIIQSLQDLRLCLDLLLVLVLIRKVTRHRIPQGETKEELSYHLGRALRSLENKIRKF